MSKKTIFSPDDIIETGKALEIERPGRDVEPWLIYKKLGARGNYERVKGIWEKHVEDRKGQPDDTFEADCIPAKFRESLDSLFGNFGSGIDTLFARYDAHLSSQFNRQIRVLQDAHAKELAEQEEEAEFWRHRALEAEQALETKAEDDKRAQGKVRPPRPRRTSKSEPPPPQLQEELPGQMRLEV